LKLRNVGYLGTSINPALFSPLYAESGPYGNPVFQLTYDMNKTTEDGCYLIPDHTIGLPEPSTDFSSLTVQITSGFDYQRWISQSVSSGGGILNMITGSGSASFNAYFRLTTSASQYVYFSSARRISYHVNFEPTFTPPLTKAFIASVARLPRSFGPANAEQWDLFLRNYNPFVIVDMRMGGTASQNVIISTFDLQTLVNGNIDVNYESGIAMAVAMGIDVQGSDRTASHIKFSTYAKIALTQVCTIFCYLN
jgi:hypothetical protein